MSKQLTGALFVDIQGDNKNLKKSLNDSKQQVAGFGAAVTQMFASNPAMAALMGGIGAAVAAGRGRGRVLSGIAGARQSVAQARAEYRVAPNAINRRFNLDSLQTSRGVMGPHPAGENQMTASEWRATAAQARRERRNGAAQEVLRARQGRGFLGHKRSALQSLRYGGKEVATAGIRAAAAFMGTGAGLMLMGTAVTAVIGTVIGSAMKRGGEGRKFDVKSIREDALTKIARIKQNVQIGKNTMGQGFRGGAERFFDRQSAGLAPAAASAGNAISGAFWGAMGLVGWMYRGGPAFATYRWATGGDFF